MHGRITYMLCRSETVIQQCICILSDTIQSFPPPIISNIPIPTYNSNHYTSTASASATADEDQPSTLQHKRNPTSDNNTFSSHARRKALQKRSRFLKKMFLHPNITNTTSSRTTTTLHSSTSVESNPEQPTAHSAKKGRKRKRTSTSRSRKWKKNKWNVTTRKY